MAGKAFRNFNDSMPELRTEEIEFELYDETFHCVPDAPGGLLPRLASAVKFDERGRRVFQQPDLVQFIEDVLIEERQSTVPRAEREPEFDAEGNPVIVAEEPDVMVVEKTDDMERWSELMRDKKRPVPIETLGEIVLWLAEKYGAERPTAPSRR